MSTYTLEEIMRMRCRIRTLNLLTPWSFDVASHLAVQEHANGIGPDRWPEHLRELVTNAFSTFEEAAVIHDWEFGHEENDGTTQRWHEANSRFHENCRRLVAASCRWWTPWGALARLRGYARAEFLYKAVETDAGFQAWSESWQMGLAGGAA